MREDFKLPDEPEFDDSDTLQHRRPAPKKASYGRDIPVTRPESLIRKSKSDEEDSLPEFEKIKAEKNTQPAATDKADIPEKKAENKTQRSLTRTRIAPVRKSRDSVPDVTEEKEPLQFDGYYAKIAKLLKNAKFAIFIFLALYILANVVLYADDITYENAKMLLYDFQNASSVGEADVVDVFRIPGQSQRSAIVFRGEICTAGEDGITLWQSDGKQILYDEKRLYSPTLTSSDRYIIFYDRGYNNYHVYNSFSGIYDAQTDFPIMHISSSDDGDYAVLSRTREYRSSIEIYSPSFKLRQRIRTDSFVLATALDSDGDTLAAMSLKANMGSFDTYFAFYDIGKSDSASSVKLSGEFVYDFCFYGTSILAVGDGGIYCIDADGEANLYYGIDIAKPSRVKLFRSRCAIGFDAAGGGSELLLADVEENITETFSFDEEIKDIEFGQKRVFVLLESEIASISLSDMSLDRHSIEFGARELLILSDSLVCTVRDDCIECLKLDY